MGDETFSYENEFGLIWDHPVYCDMDIRIDAAPNYNQDLIYFKVLKHGKFCRISMKEPKYFKSDFYLTNDEIDFIINILNSEFEDTGYSKWEIMLDALNDVRKSEDQYKINDNLPIPDYNKLKEIK